MAVTSYHRLKELGAHKLLQFDYAGFTNFLLAERTAAFRRYYIGAIREEEGNLKSKELMAAQRRLTGHLQNNGWEVMFGHMLKNRGVYQEKGVDVQIAVDLVVGAYENQFDAAIIISSDTDLIPAIAKVRSKGKTVEYVGFSKRPSYGLIAHADERRLLTRADIAKFLPAEK